MTSIEVLGWITLGAVSAPIVFLLAYGLGYWTTLGAVAAHRKEGTIQP